MKKSEGFPRKQQSILLNGSVGSGKTHLAVAIIRYLAESDIRQARFVNSTGLFIELRSAVQAGSEREVLNKYCKNQIVVFDDIGSEKITDYVQASWYHIIDKRYAERLPTIYTTNMALGDIAEYYDDRIASRLASGISIKFNSEDRRLK